MTTLHPVIAQALRPAAPLPEADALAIDMAMHADKLDDGYGKRNEASALRLQMADPRFWLS
jgi:hypothetical protein